MIPVFSCFASLAQAAAPGVYRYRPFLSPLPVWGDHAWPWLLLPLTVAIAIVYKSIKCRYMHQVPKEAAILTLWILGGMLFAAGVLAVVVQVIEKVQG